MRYLIDHVLEGIAAQRKVQILEFQAQNENLQGKVTEFYAEAEKDADRVRTQFAELTNLVGQQAFIFAEDIQEISDKLYDFRRAAPKAWKVKDLERKISENRERIERLRTATSDSNLEVFLRAVQEGGETHVSQNALKQAGFKDVNVATFIAARARAVKNA